VHLMGFRCCHRHLPGGRNPRPVRVLPSPRAPVCPPPPSPSTGRLVCCTTSCWRPRLARCPSGSLPWTTPPQTLGRWWAASLCSTTGTCVGVKEGWGPGGTREPQRSTGQAFVGPSPPPSFCWVFPSTTDDRAPAPHPLPRPPPDPLSSSARQAKITTELSEIISGSESLKDENAEA